MQSVKYAKVPRQMQNYVASLFCGTAVPGATKMPALPSQVWVCTFPAYWLPPHGYMPERLPLVGLMGPSMGAHSFLAEGAGEILGIAFRPLGWVELVRVPAQDLADRIVDATTLWPELSYRLLDQILRADSWEQKAAALLLFVTSLEKQTERSGEERLISTIDRWVASDQAISSLSAALGYSSRHVERITGRTHGASPSVLRVRERTLRAAALTTGAPRLSSQLWEPYADQSHGIRNFRRFVGTTPGRLVRRGKDLEILYSICTEERTGSQCRPLALNALGEGKPHTRTQDPSSVQLRSTL